MDCTLYNLPLQLGPQFLGVPSRRWPRARGNPPRDRSPESQRPCPGFSAAVLSPWAEARAGRSAARSPHTPHAFPDVSRTQPGATGSHGGESEDASGKLCVVRLQPSNLPLWLPPAPPWATDWLTQDPLAAEGAGILPRACFVCLSDFRSSLCPPGDPTTKWGGGLGTQNVSWRPPRLIPPS